MTSASVVDVPVPGVSVGAASVPKFIVKGPVATVLDVQPLRNPMALIVVDVAIDSAVLYAVDDSVGVVPSVV